MSVKQEANGRRPTQIEFEAAGTPEEVWQTIATGPGISAWFVPTEFEEKNGKPAAVIYHFGPGMDIRGDVTAWDSPRAFAAQQTESRGDAPPMATEWQVGRERGRRRAAAARLAGPRHRCAWHCHPSQRRSRCGDELVSVWRSGG